MKIKIDIQGRRLTLSPEEARKLFDDLSKVFVVERTIFVQPAPAQHEHAPIYIPIAYPAPAQSPAWEPPNKWNPWGGDGYPNVTCGDALPCPQTICEATV